MIIDQLGKIQLINADCMRVLSELPDNAFDLAICDPPLWAWYRRAKVLCLQKSKAQPKVSRTQRLGR